MSRRPGPLLYAQAAGWGVAAGLVLRAVVREIVRQEMRKTRAHQGS